MLMKGRNLSYNLLVAVLCVALVGNLAPRVDAQDGFRDFLQSFLPESVLEAFNLNDPPPEEVLEDLLSESEILELEKPRTGFVEEGGADIYTLTIPTNASEFPNLLLTLSVANEGGDADIYCIPTFLFNESGIVPSRSFALWGSAHSQGNDYIFISREDPQYPSSMVGIKEGGDGADGVSFVCSVHGYSSSGAEYSLGLDIDFSDRTMVKEEQEAMREIFEQCCMENDEQCAKWKSQTDEDGQVSFDFCHMRGSICNDEGRIVRLDLRKNLMACEVPVASLIKLEALEKIQMSRNRLTGNVGALLSGLSDNLPKLQHLDLAKNALTGDFSFEEDEQSPLCKLTHEAGMVFLNLEFNDITGKIPSCLFDAASTLKEIFLEGNELNSEFPEVSEESGIELIHLSGLGLRGPVPSSIGSLKSLIALDISNNKLTGALPPTLGASPLLKNIRIQNNKFEGSVPEAIAQSASLKFIRIDKNKFEKLPEGWYGGNVANEKLGVLDASFNELKGEFPVALARSRNLTYLNLHRNELGGRLPEEEGLFENLMVLDLGMNKFRGPLPESFGEAGMFKEEVRSISAFTPVFDLSDNKLTGEVPEFLFQQNLDKRMRREVQIGGNNFDLPCPLAAQLRYINNLVCDDKVEMPAEAAASPAPAQEPAVEPESEEEYSVAPLPEEEEMEEPTTEPTMAPTEGDSEPDMEPSMPEPESDMDESLEDGVGFDSVTGEVVEAPLFQGKDDSSDKEENKTRGFDVTLAASKADKEEDSGSKKKVFTGKAVGGVAVLGFLAILVIVVIAIVVVARKKRAGKEREVDEVLAPDVEMATPPAPKEGDTVHMLEGVQSSS